MHDPPVKHNERHLADVVDVCKRIRVQNDQVGFLAGGDRSDLTLSPRGGRAIPCRGDQRLHRSHSFFNEPLHAGHERAAHRVRRRGRRRWNEIITCHRDRASGSDGGCDPVLPLKLNDHGPPQPMMFPATSSVAPRLPSASRARASIKGARYP